MNKATCHPDRLRYAKGLCIDCYRKQWKEIVELSYQKENIPDLKVEDHQQNYSDWKNLPSLITV